MMAFIFLLPMIAFTGMMSAGLKGWGFPLAVR